VKWGCEEAVDSFWDDGGVRGEAEIFV
jgi:hypothetical protein